MPLGDSFRLLVLVSDHEGQFRTSAPLPIRMENLVENWMRHCHNSTSAQEQLLLKATIY
jgi:hypothetical protein